MPAVSSGSTTNAPRLLLAVQPVFALSREISERRAPNGRERCRMSSLLLRRRQALVDHAEHAPGAAAPEKEQSSVRSRGRLALRISALPHFRRKRGDLSALHSV